MSELNHDSPASIRAFLDSRELAPRKRWGQNFLINRGAREKIIRILDVEPGLNIWEIGPGLGAMSDAILNRNGILTVFEIDPAYCAWLEESLGPKGLKIVRGDVMNTWKGEWEKEKPDRILGNLPYNAASAIIASFIENDRMADISVFTVQDEMGQRMTAEPGSKEYSSFTVLCRTGGIIGDGGRLAPGSFFPAPRVKSRIVSLKPAQPCGRIANPEQFRLIVRSLFSSRRKTLNNNINSSSSRPGFPDAAALKDAFTDESIDLSRRPETVSPCQWVSVANRVADS